MVSYILKMVYVDVPFLKTLKKASTYLQFLRERFLKKGELEGVSIPLLEKPAVASYRAGH